MNKLKAWFFGALGSVAALVGIHTYMPTEKVIEVHTPSVVVQPIPAPTPTISSNRINVSCDETCSDKEKLELISVVDKVNFIERTDCFKNFLLDPKNKMDLGQTKGLTAKSVVGLITVTPINTELTYFYKGRSWFSGTLIIGYEDGDGKIHANRYAWADMSICDKASNVAHEISHDEPLNFEHSMNYTPERDLSVPYSINKAFDACCQ